MSFLLLCPALLCAAATEEGGKEMGLHDVRQLIHQNRSLIIERLNRDCADEQLRQQQSERLPDIGLDGEGYLSNEVPLNSSRSSLNDWFYNFNLNLNAEWDIYTGGMHKYAIERMKNDVRISEERIRSVEQEVELQAYLLLYDIYRNIKYRDFIRSSIRLRSKEYDRIGQLYENGTVLKSDLLRSKLYITDLQKDEVTIENSIEILSRKLYNLLGMEDEGQIRPQLEQDLDFHLNESFETMYAYALENAPSLAIRHSEYRREETVLKEIRAERLPRLKAYARYGIGAAQPSLSYRHRLGGEVGARISIPLSSLYKSKHRISAQRQRILQQEIRLNDAEQQLRETIYELYTRYSESLLNIDRALEKIEMSKESMRILRNSYFNQQSLLIDVLESETQSMEASFEWVEAVVDAQKYYWSLRQICGYL